MTRFQFTTICAALTLFSSAALTYAGLSAPRALPGMTGVAAATGKQDKPRIARGGETSLAVWSDTRSALAGNGTISVGGGGPYFGPGLGTMNDIYAARLDAGGNVIDAHPIVVSAGSYNQSYPRVAWNGQNWLVAWYQELENDYGKYELRAVRVSPQGTVIDQVPFKIGQTSDDFGDFPAELLFDGTNWVLFWESTNAKNSTRSIFAARIAADGTVLDPAGVSVYDHPTQFLTSPDVAYNGSGYLLVFHDLWDDKVYGQRLAQNLAPAGARFPINTYEPSVPTRPQVDSNGSGYLVVWDEHPASGNIGAVKGSRVSATGQVLDGSGIVIDNNVGVSESTPDVQWSGGTWFVTYSSGYHAPTNTYAAQSIYVRRVASTGVIVDPTPIRLSNPANTSTHAIFPAITAGFDDAVQVVWHDLRDDEDIYTARVSPAGAPDAERVVSLGAPRQSRPRMAFGGDVFMTVFQREIAGKAQIFAQRLTSAGQPLDRKPIQISTGPNETNRNPAIAFNGTNFFVVWERSERDQFGNAVRKVFGRLLSPAGAPLNPPFFVMTGTTPDVAALDGTFLTVAIQPIGSQMRYVQSVRVSAAGAVLGSPATVLSGFNFGPRVARLGARWLVVWEYRSRHDASTSWIYGAFVEPSGTPSAGFQVAASDSPFGSGNSYDHAPHLAVSGSEALIVWSDNDTNLNNIKGRQIDAAGTLLGSNYGFVISGAAGSQFSPAASWDGQNYVVTWLDQRNEQYPVQPRGDIYAARVGVKGAVLQTFPVANSPVPQETPFVASGNGATVFAYTAFRAGKPHSAMRVVTRTSTP